MAYVGNLAHGPAIGRGPDCSIEQLLQERVFDPDILVVMAQVYDRTRQTLGLASRCDPATELLAQTVIEVVERGTRDPEQAYRRTLAALRRGHSGWE